jgi:fructose-1,6-bisphosphatase/inositol monophosphatase family enzyme
MTDMQTHLRAAFEQVRSFLLAEGLTKLGIVQENARGDVTKEFDYLAEGRIIEYFAREVSAPIRVLTEERGEVRTRTGAPAWTLVVDPVDGSENFARGNEFSCVSLALIPGGGGFGPEDVQFGLVGQIFTGAVYEAERGQGARKSGRPARPSAVTDISQAIVAIDFNFRGNPAVQRIYRLLGSIRDARRFASAAFELVSVAAGGTDAYVDVRETLSPENYLAAYRIVREAGGIVTDRSGHPLAPIQSMTQGQSIVAAGTPALHAAVLEALAG